MFLKEASWEMSSSVMPSLGRSTSSVSSVTVIFLMLTMETGRLVLICEETAPDSSSIYSFREMSWMAPSSLLLASESSFELRSREESI